MALTPPAARGKRQIQEQAELVKAATAIRKAHNVETFLTYTFERQEKRETKYIGRGRGNANRPTREMVSVRYQILTVVRQEAVYYLPTSIPGYRWGLRKSASPFLPPEYPYGWSGVRCR